MTGRLWIFANASVAVGELSVLMVVPMAMKKLFERVKQRHSLMEGA